MEKLAEIIVSLFNLLEAEGRLLRANVLRSIRLAGVTAVGIGLLFTAAGFLVAALYSLLAIVMPVPAALALVGVGCLIAAMLLLWIPKKKTLKKKTDPTTT